MSSERSKVFTKNVPDLEEEEILEAAKNGHAVIGFSLFPLPVNDYENIGFLTVKVRMSNGREEIILLDRFAAEILRIQIQKLNDANWKPSQKSSPKLN